MKRFLLLVSIIVCSVVTQSAVASDLPLVRQPNDPTLSSADRAALPALWAAIEAVLQPDYVLSRLVQLRGLTWGDADYAAFVAGALESAGFPCLLATGSWGGTTGVRTWVLVEIPVSLGKTYIPVEASPALLLRSSSIGQIGWQGGGVGTLFDARYLDFTHAVAPAPNAPPAVSLTVAGWAVVGDAATLQVLGIDPDGSILGYIWSISDGTTVAGTQPVLWHTFEDTGDATLVVEVIDQRGGCTRLFLDIEVLAEEPNCGCGGSH